MAILTSEKFENAVLGINLPGIKGLSKSANNKKYYLWELTAKGIEPGFVDPVMANPRYWDITLRSK